MIFKSNFFRDISNGEKSLEQRKQLVDSFPEPADDIERTALIDKILKYSNKLR